MRTCSVVSGLSPSPTFSFLFCMHRVWFIWVFGASPLLGVWGEGPQRLAILARLSCAGDSASGTEGQSLHPRRHYPQPSFAAVALSLGGKTHEHGPRISLLESP